MTALGVVIEVSTGSIVASGVVTWRATVLRSTSRLGDVDRSLDGLKNRSPISYLEATKPINIIKPIFESIIVLSLGAVSLSLIS
jgi:hypothetical protein